MKACTWWCRLWLRQGYPSAPAQIQDTVMHMQLLGGKTKQSQASTASEWNLHTLAWALLPHYLSWYRQRNLLLPMHKLSEGIKALTGISLSWEAPSTTSLPAETKLVNLNFSKAKQSRWGVLAQLGTNFSWEMAKKKRLHYFLSELKMGLKSGWVLPGSQALIEFLGKKAAAHD